MLIWLLRILRAVAGVFGMIMIKATTKPAVDFVLAQEWTSPLLQTVLFRLALSVLGFTIFFGLRSIINDRHVSKHPNASLLLHHKWSL